MSNKVVKSLTVAVGAALLGSVAIANASSFSLSDLDQGYQQVGEEKGKEASCGADKGKEGKCGEGKCGADKAKGKEGSCGGDKAKEGSCGGDKAKEKGKEGSCGGAA